MASKREQASTQLLENIICTEFGITPADSGAHKSPQDLLALPQPELGPALGQTLIQEIRIKGGGDAGAELLFVYGEDDTSEWTDKLRYLSIEKRQGLLFILQHIQLQLSCFEESLPKLKQAMFTQSEMKAFIQANFIGREQAPPEPHFMKGHFEGDLPDKIEFDGEYYLLLPNAFHHFTPLYFLDAIDKMSAHQDWLDLRHEADGAFELSWQFDRASDDKTQAKRLSMFSSQEKKAILVVLRHLMLFSGTDTDVLGALQRNLGP
jgi:hypothetical protein